MNANSDREYIDNKVGDVRTAVDDLRVSVSERLDALRTTMDERLDALRTTMDERFIALRTTMDERFDALRTTMDERSDALRATMDERFKAIDAKIENAVSKGVSEVVKWVVGLFVTTIALNVALASVVLHVALREPPPPPPAVAPAQPITTPAVIIQLSPQGAAVLPAAPAGGKP
ncbi:hypothetical protein [Duganella radicis]|uniref:DUF1640 domain-containing protein n=1 Tax=Duganella radicis TaxID=551988 RepID=A0A6L6PRQ0_9BURK|nr:hypothetical protein [Duganella radicis]MTV41321.1 hypothetical protein [Duganella radicis]